MTVDTEGFRDAHHELLEHAAELRFAAERLPALTTSEREQTRGCLLSFLRDRVEPHTKLDELLLYPEAARRLGDPLMAASMNYDHLAIRHWIALIEAADVSDTARLQHLLYGLDALIRVHIWKENELFLAPLESRSWPTLRQGAGPEAIDG
jgi:hypothetical protein